MAMSRITLTAPAEVIRLAETQAKAERTSISAMFVNFIRAKSGAAESAKAAHKIGPLTRSITGAVRLPARFDEKRFMAETLSVRHGFEK